MSAIVVVIGLLLAGQVTQPTDRYGNPISPPPAANTDGAATQGQAASQVLPLDDSSAGTRQPANTQPTNAGGNPFRNQSGALPTAPVRATPPAGTATPPPGVAQQQPSRLETPLSSNQAASAAPPTTTNVKPSAMIKMMLTAPPGAEVSGDRVTLVDVVGSAPTRMEQTQRIEAYWDLCASVADYYLGLREQEELRQLRTMLPRVGATWQQAEAEMAVRMSTSKRAAIASQLRLASWMVRGPDSLPLPADLPHCGSYHTRYDEIFATRPNAEAQELAALLPLRYAEIKDAAAAVTRGQDWMRTTVQGDSGDGTATLRALEFLALRRRAFVQLVRDYNRRIARYTALATPGAVAAERLVTMLIKRDDLPTATRPSLPTGTNGRQSQNAIELDRRTFADEGWESSSEPRSAGTRRDAAVEQTAAESPPERRERSLLVTPP